jgi:uncharacterized Tic20 family protein
MTEEVGLTQNEKALAAFAHGSILLGVFTGGIGGILAALVIWLVEKDKSVYAAAQALQALVYQAVAFVITMLVWCCWGLLWVVMILVPLSANSAYYETSAAPPAGVWVGLVLMIIPIGIWGLTVLYGLYGAVRCLGGHDFRYAIIGNWLKRQ